MTISSQSKALAASKALSEWVKKREAAGDTQRYIRAGKLNKSAVANEVGFARSAWQTNPRLAEIAEQLDHQWGSKNAPTTKASLLMRAYIDRHTDLNNMLPNQAGALFLNQIIDEAGVSPNEYASDTVVRELLRSYADANGLSVSLPGYVAAEEDTRGRIPKDPSEMVPAKKLREAQTRLSQLEKAVADLRTSNAALRAEKLRSKAIEDLIAAGGRISPGAIK